MMKMKRLLAVFVALAMFAAAASTCFASGPNASADGSTPESGSSVAADAADATGATSSAAPADQVSTLEYLTEEFDAPGLAYAIKSDVDFAAAAPDTVFDAAYWTRLAKTKMADGPLAESEVITAVTLGARHYSDWKMMIARNQKVLLKSEAGATLSVLTSKFRETPTTEPLPTDGDIVAVTRQDEEAGIFYAYIYNKAQDGADPADITLSFSEPGKPYAVDDWTGAVTEIPRYDIRESQVAIPFTLLPGESRIVAIDLEDEGGVHALESNAEELIMVDGAVRVRALATGSYEIDYCNGSYGTVKATVPEAIELTELDAENADGYDSYSATFDIPVGWGATGAYLQLGSTGGGTVAATVNGKKTPAFNIDTLKTEIFDLLVEGENEIVIEEVAPPTEPDAVSDVGEVAILPYVDLVPMIVDKPAPAPDAATEGGAAAVADPEAPVSLFADVSVDDWYFNDVATAYRRGLMFGVSEDPLSFGPDQLMSRAMIVTTLWRNEGSEMCCSETNYVDVEQGTWYVNAVGWAVNNNIVFCQSCEEFFPDQPITREELATIMAAYADYAGIELIAKSEYAPFADENLISNEGAKDDIIRLNRAGIMLGKPGDLFDPKGTSNRAEVTAMIIRLTSI